MPSDPMHHESPGSPSARGGCLGASAAGEPAALPDRYARLFHLVREGLAHYQGIYDETGTLIDLLVLDINPAGAKLSGVAAEDQVGRTWRSIWPDVSDDLISAYRSVDQTGESVRFDHESPLTGRIYDVVISKAAPAEFIVTFNDITERKAAEEARIRSEARLLATLQSIPDEVWIVDESGRVVLVSDAVTRHLGVLPGRWEDIREAANELEIFCPDGTPRAPGQAPLARSLKGEVIDRELEVIRNIGTGGMRWREATSSPIRDSRGQITGAVAVVRDITERKQAEEALRASESRYRQLFDSMPEGFFVAEVITDESGAPADYRYLEVNPALEEITGLRRDDLLGRRVTQARPGVDRYWIETFGKVALTREPCRFEHHSTHVDRWHAGYAYSPNPGQFATTFVDVTDRKRIEEALRDTTDRLSLTVDATEIGAFDYYPATGKLIWSTYAKRHFGLSPDAEVTYQTFLQGLHPDDRERVHNIVQQVMSPDSSGEYRTQYRTIGIDDGQERWLDARGRVFFDDTGAPARFIGVTQDVTARRRAEERFSEMRAARERERELLQAIVENIPVMLCIYDPALLRFTVNREFERVLGWTNSDANEGDFVAKVYPDADYRREVADFMLALTPGWREFDATAKDGSVVASEWANIKLSDDRMVGIGMDVRARKRIEQALRLNLRQLQSAFDGMVEPVLLADRNANVIAMNAAYLELFEYDVAPRTREELLGDFEFTNPDGSALQLDQSPFSTAMRGEVVRDIELRGLNKRTGRTFHILTGASPVRDADGNIVAAIITSHDITGRKRSE